MPQSNSCYIDQTKRALKFRLGEYQKYTEIQKISKFHRIWKNLYNSRNTNFKSQKNL